MIADVWGYNSRFPHDKNITNFETKLHYYVNIKNKSSGQLVEFNLYDFTRITDALMKLFGRGLTKDLIDGQSRSNFELQRFKKSIYFIEIVDEFLKLKALKTKIYKKFLKNLEKYFPGTFEKALNTTSQSLPFVYLRNTLKAIKLLSEIKPKTKNSTIEKLRPLFDI